MSAAASVQGTVAPSLKRRLASFVYEGVLLFGVLMLAGFVFSTLTGQRNAMIGRQALQGFMFVVLGGYFGWFWCHGGQTVAMKAWRIRLVTERGDAVGVAQALARYLLGWLWFAPALLVAWLSGVHSQGAITGILLAGVLTYALLARLHPSRQFVHDLLSGTRLIDAGPAPAGSGHNPDR